MTHFLVLSANIAKNRVCYRRDRAIDVRKKASIKIISDAYECLNSSGNEILIGVPRFKQKASFYTLDLHLGKSLIGCKGGNFQPDKDLNNYLKIINKKEFQLKKHITNEVELRDINDVFSDMKRNKLAGKCIVNLM